MANIFEDNSFRANWKRQRDKMSTMPLSRMIYSIESPSSACYQFWEEEVLELEVEIISLEEWEAEVALWSMKKP
jgi:hypothetical protein